MNKIFITKYYHQCETAIYFTQWIWSLSLKNVTYTSTIPNPICISQIAGTWFICKSSSKYCYYRTFIQHRLWTILAWTLLSLSLTNNLSNSSLGYNIHVGYFFPINNVSSYLVGLFNTLHHCNTVMQSIFRHSLFMSALTELMSISIMKKTHFDSPSLGVISASSIRVSNK